MLSIKAKLQSLPPDPIVDEKRRNLDHILQECLGIEVQTTVPQAEVVPGETITLHHSVHSNVPLRWESIRYPSIAKEVAESTELAVGQTVSADSQQTIPADTPLSQPYWLREDGTPGMFRVDEPSLIGRPENPPVFPVEFVFEVAGQKLVVSDQPVSADESHRRIDVIPPVSLKFGSAVQLFAPGAAQPVAIDATAYRPNSIGTIQLDMPTGWTVVPSSQPFELQAVGDKSRFTFTVTAASQAAVADIRAHVLINGATFAADRIEIHYSHIPFILLQPPARLKAVAIELATRGHQLGYLPGAGDSVADGLVQMGYSVTQLAGPDLTAEKLHDLDAIVVGVRAFAVRKDLTPAAMAALADFVQAGGNLIVQYVRPESGLQSISLGPYELRLSSQRVTDPNATMTFLVPDHPALNTPNKITAADFDGWVQERGTYFPSSWDDHFVPIFACNDAGEPPLKGSLLIAPFGKGNFVYTGLGFFRQLPAGTPGAYRLLANLVSLGK